MTLAFALRRDILPGLALAYVGVQIAGGIAGVWLTHVMFDLPVLQFSAPAAPAPISGCRKSLPRSGCYS